jgi:hypothetical protein
MDARHDAIVRFRIRDLLSHDKFIIESATYYDIAPIDWVKDKLIDGLYSVEFTLKLTLFDAWLAVHESAIGANFIHKKDYESKKTGQSTYYYRCQCYGNKRVRKEKMAGGSSGKPWVSQKASIKCDCRSRIEGRIVPKGIKEKSLLMTYHYQHSHNLASLEDIGSRQKSDRIKATIQSLLLQGSSIKNVMMKFTMDYDRFIAIYPSPSFFLFDFLQDSRSDGLSIMHI